MPIPLLVAGAAAAAPSIYQAINSAGQRRQAKRIRERAVNPGYEMNSGVLQNEEILKNRYGNYQIPGFNQALNNITTSGASAFLNGVQGASSSADVLDLATKIAYGTGRQKRDLAMENAEGRDRALFDYLGANVAAGEERQSANAYDRQQYERQLAEAAALYNASDQNMNTALTGLSSIGTSLLMNPGAKIPTMGQKLGNPTLAPAGMAGAGINQQGVNTNPLVQYNGLNPVLSQSGMAGFTNDGQVRTKPLIPIKRRGY